MRATNADVNSSGTADISEGLPVIAAGGAPLIPVGAILDRRVLEGARSDGRGFARGMTDECIVADGIFEGRMLDRGIFAGDPLPGGGPKKPADGFN